MSVLLTPDMPLTTAEGKTLADILGHARFLEAVKKNMADDYREIVIDSELEAAVLAPTQPIRIMGVCRPQAVYLKGDDFQAANCWQPHVLENAVHADLWVDKLRVKPKKERHGGRRHEAAVGAA